TPRPHRPERLLAPAVGARGGVRTGVTPDPPADSFGCGTGPVAAVGHYRHPGAADPPALKPSAFRGASSPLARTHRALRKLSEHVLKRDFAPGIAASARPLHGLASASIAPAGRAN